MVYLFSIYYLQTYFLFLWPCILYTILYTHTKWTFFVGFQDTGWVRPTVLAGLRDMLGFGQKHCAWCSISSSLPLANSASIWWYHMSGFCCVGLFLSTKQGWCITWVFVAVGYSLKVDIKALWHKRSDSVQAGSLAMVALQELYNLSSYQTDFLRTNLIWGL